DHHGDHREAGAQRAAVAGQYREGYRHQAHRAASPRRHRNRRVSRCSRAAPATSGVIAPTSWGASSDLLSANAGITSAANADRATTIPPALSARSDAIVVDSGRTRPRSASNASIERRELAKRVT